MRLAVVAARVFTESRPALEKAVAGGKTAAVRAAAVDALAALAFVAGEEPDDTDEVLALLAALWQNGAGWGNSPGCLHQGAGCNAAFVWAAVQGGLGENPSCLLRGVGYSAALWAVVTRPSETSTSCSPWSMSSSTM